MLNSCLVVAHAADESIIELLRRRYAALVRFYEPLGADPGSERPLEHQPLIRLAYGQIGLVGGEAHTSPVLA